VSICEFGTLDFRRRSLSVTVEQTGDPSAPAPGEGRAMSSRQIGRQAPYLRRYARALTGSQALGDGVVAAALEGLLRGAIPLDEEFGLRPALFAALHKAWRAQTASEAASRPEGADQRLQTLGLDERAALLLVAMEGFSLTEGAEILGCNAGQMREWLDAADAAIRNQLSARVLIIEDEPIIGLDLTRLARELGHEVLGVAATRDEAVTMAQRTLPGLILADVRLADGSSGMDAAADILESFDIPVIFITAFPEHLLTGDRPEPAFLITKPFREDAVKALISQALFFHAPARGAALHALA
jgi:DNA-directed RNA polymerase specialized sigma24 family protein/CheY-like chemotaxis protein